LSGWHYRPAGLPGVIRPAAGRGSRAGQGCLRCARQAMLHAVPVSGGRLPGRAALASEAPVGKS
jgi:hypothetical protein